MSTSTRPPRIGRPAGTSPPPPPAEARRSEEMPGAQPRPTAQPIGWGSALIGAGVLWLLVLAGVQIEWRLVLPIAIIAIGLVLLAGGRRVARGGLVGLGIALTVVALVTSVTPVQASISAGDRTYTVTDLAELESSYSLGAGTLTLDLRELELAPGTTQLDASVSMGELVVRVPDGATVIGTGQTTAGEVDGFGRNTAGIAPRRAFDAAGVEGGSVLDLDLRTGLGRIEVTR